MSAAGRVALVIVSYGSATLVEQNVSALATEWPDLDLVIVDSFTDRAEQERLGAVCARHGWEFVPLGENRGFGGGVNAGAARAFDRGATAMIVLNPDATLAYPDAVALASATVADPNLLAAPVIRTPDGALWTEGIDLYLDDGTMAGIRHRDRLAPRARMFWVSGACFAISRDLWGRVGGFVDDYFLYWEDVDLSRRVAEAGGSVRVLPDVTAVHDEGGTHDDRIAGRAKSETYYYYNIRNRLIFARRNLGSADALRWRRSAVRVSWGIVLQGGRRQLLTSVAPWRALRRGLRDGRRSVTGQA